MVSLELLCLFPPVKARCFGPSFILDAMALINPWIFCCFRLAVFVRWIPVLFDAVVTPSGLLQQSFVLEGIGILHSWDQLCRGWYWTEQLNLDCWWEP